jgi:hypothetical protein
MPRHDLSRILAPHQGGDVRTARALPFPPASPDGSPAATFPGARVIFPPWLYKIPEASQDFNVETHSAVLPAGVGATVSPAALQFTILPNQIGWIQVFGYYVLAQDATTDITWTLTINGGPVPGWNNWGNPPGTLSLFERNITDLQVRLPPGAQAGILITNNAASGPWTVGGRISGWYHPQVAEHSWYGIGG